MRKLLLILLLLVACEPDDGPLYYNEFELEQPVMLTLNVYPMEDVEIDIANLLKEVNADYFNPHGIGVNVVLQPRQPLPQEVKDAAVGETRMFFVPPSVDGPKTEQYLYVIPDFYMPSGIAGYALGRGRSVVKLKSLYGSTVAHEIGHNLTLGHVTDWDNVMYRVGTREQRGKPREFLQAQVDTMLNFLAEPVNFESLIIDHENFSKDCCADHAGPFFFGLQRCKEPLR